jgi:hypothetical protein
LFKLTPASLGAGEVAQVPTQCLQVSIGCLLLSQHAFV